MKRMNSNRRTSELQFERLEKRELMAIDLAGLLQPGELSTYSVDGTGNNLVQTERGSTNEDLIRLAAAEYGDGIGTPAGSNRPSAREISNTLCDQGSADIISKRDLSAFVYAWGQFIDHDFSRTPGANTEAFNIAVPKGDPYFDPAGTATKVINMARSFFDPATGTSSSNPRQQINAITAWLDGSMIYGSDTAVAQALRSFNGGKLKMDSAGMLPLNNSTNFPGGTVPADNIPGGLPNDQLYAAGDLRANENIELTSLHTLFVREHNRWADRLAKANPQLNDQELYQRARAVVIAEIQSITFNEWLPAILGDRAMPLYRGYNSQVNPNLSNEFATAAFRFGHSILGDDIRFLDSNGLPVAEDLDLKDAFFNPALLRNHSIDSVFKYLASDPASELDTKLVNSVRNFLFGPPGSGGFDLAALNIQRGRDHGLADYNDTRAAVGLPRVQGFADITRNREMQTKLQQLYGSVENIDLWVGILAEDAVPGGSIGPTGQKIIADQFSRMRDGDRFWYQNQFGGNLLREIEQTRLSDVVQRNTSLTNVQRNAFYFHAAVSGTVFQDANGNRLKDRSDRALAGFTVELRNSEGLVASAVTDRFGRYQFNVQTGIRTGQYTVTVTKSPDGQNIKPASKPIAVTRGDQAFQVDFGIGPDRRGGKGGGPGPQAIALAMPPAATDQAFIDIFSGKRRR